MKNFLLTFLLCFSFIAIGTSQVSFGGGITYLDDIGIQARVNVPVSNLTFIPKFNYYFVDLVTAMKFDADFAFNVAELNGGDPIYAFAGPSLYRVSAFGTSASEIGLNLGGGANFSSIYVEVYLGLLFCDGCSNEIGFSAGYMF